MNDGRVILIQGDNTKCYEQAIFIMKPGLPGNRAPVDLVAEAEKIINGYSAQRRAPAVQPHRPAARGTAKRRNKSFDVFLNVVMLLSCLLLAGMIVQTFM